MPRQLYLIYMLPSFILQSLLLPYMEAFSLLLPLETGRSTCYNFMHCHSLVAPITLLGREEQANSSNILANQIAEQGL